MFLLDDLQLNAPGPPQVTSLTAQVVGSIGARQYWYWVVAKFPIGPSLTGPVFQRNAPDTLNATNYVKVVWDAAIAATSYDVLRTDTPAFPTGPGNFALAIGLSATTTTYNDQGAALLAYNPTGLTYGAPVMRQIHLNNRDYSQPTMEVDAPLKVPVLAFADGSTQTTAAGASSSQTPWLTDINGNGHSLTGALNIGATGTISTTGAVNASSFTINGQPFSIATAQSPWIADVNGNGKNLTGVNVVSAATLAGNAAQLNNSVTIGSASSNQLFLQGDSWALYMAGSPRWFCGLSGAETGSNAGSNLVINRYSDTGAFLGAGLTINRATGNVALTGVLSVGAAVNANDGVNVYDAAGGGSFLYFRSGSQIARWALGKNNAVESGSNTGSDFNIYRYSDAGALLGSAVTINRASGTVTLSGSFNVDNAATGGTGTSFSQYLQNNVARWTTGKNATAESGSNAGSDYVINRYNDAGTSLGAAMTITRSSGNVLFSGQVQCQGRFYAVSPISCIADASPNAYYFALTAAAISRWSWGKNSTTETGSNVGSDFVINRYDDSAALLGTPFMITRSTGNVGVGTTTPAATFVVNGGADTLPAPGAIGSRFAILVNNAYGLLIGGLGSGTGYIQQQRVDTLGTLYPLLLQPNGGPLGVGATAPFNRLTVSDVSHPASDASNGLGNLSLTSGTGAQADDMLLFGVHTGDYSWIQAVKPGTSTRNLILQPNGSNIGIGLTNPSATVHVLAGGATGVMLLDRAYTAPSHILIRGAAGTVTSPAPITTGNGIGRVSFVSYDGAWGTTGLVGMQSIATENQGPANHGASLNFYTVPNGGTAELLRMKLDQDGTATFSGALAATALPSVAPAAGSKQFWYDPADGNRVKYVP